ncbi:anthranilate phosphoribosyltransferase [Achromatium sp. WMS2]|nr:anthranilate phosphoribosyltransferase [Achromatium sp. WMS2]
MNVQQAIAQIIANSDLSYEQMTAVMRSIMHGEATDAQIGGFLIGLRLKSETITEITAAATVMRELSQGVDISGLPNTVDIVGTGGDGAKTFNISTASMFVAAAAGCHVAKHGNRSVSSSSGSADVLEAAGTRIDLNPDQIAQCVRKLGIGFMFAPHHHGAMRYAIGPRRELGVRTIFNVLGPLTNPARVPNQVLGIFDASLLTPIVEVSKCLGNKHSLVVHSEDGLDEISVGAATNIAELQHGQIRYYSIAPEDFGIQRTSVEALKVNNAQDSLQLIQKIFDNQPGPGRDIVALNAGAAIYVAGKAESLAAGYAMADSLIKDKLAQAKFREFIEFTRNFAVN